MNKRITFTKEELEYLSEMVHDALKDDETDTALQSLEHKLDKALGYTK